MNDKRQPARASGGDMGAENPRGNGAWVFVVMIIEPGFANADAFRVPRQLDQAILRHFGFFMRVMRMRPNCAKDVLVGFGDEADRTKSFSAGRNGDHPLKPGGAGAFDHGIAFGAEIRKIEVAMTVNQHNCLQKRATTQLKVAPACKITLSGTYAADLRVAPMSHRLFI